MEKARLVYIEFLDHVADGSWMSQDEIKEFEPIKCFQIGWLSGETKKCYKVSSNLNENGQIGNTMVILKSTVTRFVEIDLNLGEDK